MDGQCLLSHAHMRISWLEPALVDEVCALLEAWNARWEAHFAPEFRVPPAPPSIRADRWPKVAEHVARAERVAAYVREHGQEKAEDRFWGSPHAIELASLVATAMRAGFVRFDLVVALLEAAVDDLVVYGQFLQLLEAHQAHDRDRAVAVYERFCAAITSLDSREPDWNERISTVRDGLAGFYVRTGRLDQAHVLYSERFEAEPDSMLSALGAARTFLAAGFVEHAIPWLGRGAERADALGKGDMAERLRAKSARLCARL